MPATADQCLGAIGSREGLAGTTLAADLAAASLDLARRFAAGATMWCCAPEWTSHASHVAVEFVHPVIVGKRAFPALVAEGRDLVATIRLAASPGDILLAIARGDDEAVGAAMRRSPAWGLRSFWIGTGTGTRPPAGAADHVLWLDTDVETAAFGGGFVLVYHLLWELTHVCFEHPGLLNDADGDCGDVVCVTCSDEGRLAEVISSGPPNNAQVRTAKGIETIDTTLIGTPAPGDLVLVHAGSAMSLLEG